MRFEYSCEGPVLTTAAAARHVCLSAPNRRHVGFLSHIESVSGSGSQRQQPRTVKSSERQSDRRPWVLAAVSYVASKGWNKYIYIRLNGGQQFVSNHLASVPRAAPEQFFFPLGVRARAWFCIIVRAECVLLLLLLAGRRAPSCKLQLTAQPPVVQFTLGRALFFYRRLSSANHLLSWMRCQRFNDQAQISWHAVAFWR